MNTQIEVLVIGRPSRFRDSIHLLLASISSIEKIYMVDALASALKMAVVPAVVVMDANGDHFHLPAALNQIKNIWPQAGRIVLVEDEQEFKAAQAAGADFLLRKGFQATQFINAVAALLSN